MGKKKAFINKKEAQHFHVVHRSQRDPLINDPTASKFVLLSATQAQEFDGSQAPYDSGDDDDDDMPDLVASAPTKQVRFGNVVAQDLVNELGMVNDGYDYTKHMREIGHGQFYSAGGTYDEGAGLLSKRVVLPDDVLASNTVESERMLEAITLTEDVMDEDLREALTNEDAFEELNDDFMLQAAEDNGEDDGAADGFDYEAHIAKLMAAADGIPKYRGNLSDDEDDDELDSDDEEEFSDDDDDDAYGESKDDAQRALDEAFEKLMEEEYDDEEIGELDEEETRGELLLEGALLESIVQDYVHLQEEVMQTEGRIGNPLRTGNRLQEVLAECAAEDALYESEEEAEPELANMDDIAHTNPYLAPRVEDQWDCETIVSTYSNLDNHPTLLREPRRENPKKKKKNANHIILSSKTGMPLNITPISEEAESQHDDAVSYVGSVVPQLVRNRQETKEEKKERKLAAKAHKQERRTDKKETKNIFKDEKIRQLNQHGPRAGSVSFFKY
ncbi:hypothetical protein SPRG_12132 [Saprolegnia parasitica CBS 223.65]|uniref:Low temperature viability protein n=1 Tax=Saprolegnia parasitica (strain CBS 223.65) TaxID=695850 RepID=A0A067C671_SAPPC|nr:hypothetical protein SPRG_12132 [Saprolegnia parasitica CBS 223.65]KDO22292.1 hypothetical protein SPRG_12132 [Saprolegnia parasitica CBS 223.65]|eukprot:XP_012207026.1 hypothetical protein SPRG_12132 [Saprolegnia parasitica CBS 223.65]